MKKLPIIAIPCRHDNSANYFKREINSQNNTYIQAVVDAGGAPFLIPMEVSKPQLQALYQLVDGVLLTGGGDIDPTRYNQPIDDLTKGIQIERDRVEFMLADWAIADGKPLLGICRGFQVLAVAAGGELYQDIETMIPTAGRHDYLPIKGGFSRDYLSHGVTLDANSRLAKIVQSEKLMVNSLHHQGLKNIPAPYQITGHADDGLPEVIDSPNHPFFVGVQWHPEELVGKDEASRRIFSAFVDACQAIG